MAVFQLLSAKPQMYVANVDEASAGAGGGDSANSNPYLMRLRALGEAEGRPVLAVSAALEESAAGK